MPDDRLDGPDQGSDDALIHHRARHPDEARGVRPEHVITGAPVPHRCRIARIVHVAHDRVQSLLKFRTAAYGRFVQSINLLWYRRNFDVRDGQ